MPNPLNMIVNVANNLFILARDRLFGAPVSLQSINYTTWIQVDTSDETKFEIFPGIPPEIGNKIVGYLSEEEQLPLRLINHAFRLRVDNFTVTQIAQWDAQQEEIDHFIAKKDYITSKFKNSTHIMSALESVKHAPTIKLLATLLARERILDNINSAIIKERIENPFPILHLYLNLSSCCLTRFPASIINRHPTFFNSVTILCLSGNRLQTLPENFKQLANLEWLTLSCNMLKSVPNGMKDLNKLNDLALTSNQISLLPNWIGELVSLDSLYIGSNKLTELPASISQLTELKDFYIDNNNLESIPDLSTLTKLEYLIVAYNNIRTFPSGLAENTTFKKLNISNNCLTEIPESFPESKFDDYLTKPQVLASQKPSTKRKNNHRDDDEKENSTSKRLRA